MTYKFFKKKDDNEAKARKLKGNKVKQTSQILNKLKNITLATLLGLMFAAPLLHAGAPLNITFQATLATQQGGLVQGRHKVVVGLYSGRNAIPVWTETHENVLFVNGNCSLILGTIQPLKTEDFSKLTNPNFGIKLDTGTKVAYFPIPSSPYSIQSKIADVALAVSANNISGVFTNPVRMNSNLSIGDNTLYVKNSTGKVGIGTTSPTYALDVAGQVNATGYKINGVDLESSLSWQKNSSNSIYYTAGNVGIATQNPQSLLDVAGTVNAQEIRIKGIELSTLLATQLAWKEGSKKSYIYFNDGTQEGNVGIGTTSPRSKLDVAGAIRVGETTDRGAPGSIQYKDNRFQGFTGTRWISFASLSGSGSANQIPFWASSTELAGSNNLIWNRTNNKMGIGTANPTAQLSMTAIDDSRTLLRIDNKLGQPIFVVGSKNIGIGTATPTSSLSVKGIVDAEAFLINGAPIAQSLSSSSFWVFQNDGRIYYDRGNVGIGTTNPSNLLELAASPSRDPVLTFDINNTPAFSIGISEKNPNSFILGKGGDLTSPVFVFNGNKIGVGLANPSANLHVSGNNGVLFTGTLDNGTPLGIKGAGTRMIWHPGKAAFRAGYVPKNQWDEENIGRFSVAYGYSSTANATGATVGGGYENEASGDFATVPGGFQNKAKGIRSFAGGHQALALHSGAFVWSDYSPTASETSFRSVAPNQFVVRATNGVGIGTNDTRGSGLTVKADQNDTYVLKTLQNDGTAAMVVTSTGNVGIGTTNPGGMKLAVVNGRVGIGTTTPTAQLTVSGNTNSNFLFVAYKNDGSPAMFIKKDGRIGIGKPLSYEFPSNVYFAFSGAQVGNSFAIQNPNGSTTELQNNPGSPWATPSENSNTTFFNKGFVGIGTTQPSSLLELSNAASSTRNPVITFETNGVKRFSLGPTRNVFTIQRGCNINGTNPVFALTDNGSGSGGVGIGIGYKVPSASLHVGASAIFTNKVVIATTNTNQIYDLTVDGPANVKSLYINGRLLDIQKTQWQTHGLNIAYTSGNVGIGTTNPRTKLEVAGTVSANQVIQTNSFTLNGSLTTSKLKLRDVSANSTVYGELQVANEQLVYKNPLGQLKVISSPLRRDSSGSFDGKLAYWIDESTVGVSNINWLNASNELAVSGNFVVKAKTLETSSGFTADTKVTMGLPEAVSIVSTINHGGDLRTVRSFTAQNILVNVQRNWGNINSPVTVKGLDITLKQTNGSLFLNQAKAIGLNVDVSKINVAPNTSGQKAAATFMGGFVGIGTTTPRAALEVAGTVSANYFNLTGGLTVPELAVNDTALVAFRDSGGGAPRVGIGTSTPRTELEVIGKVSANTMVVSGGLTVTTLNVNQGTLFVNQAGNIGIGTTLPNGQIELKKTLTTTPSNPFFSEKINVNINGAGQDQTFAFNKNLTGLDITMDSASGSQIGSGKSASGVSINMTNLTAASTSRIVGLDVNVTGTTGKRYAAIFQGGRVGIGVTNPTAELQVSGSIKADNLILDGTLVASVATFNKLTISQSGNITGAVTMNSLTVLGRLSANSLALSTPLTAQQGTFATLNAQIASINSATLSTVTLTNLNGASASATFNRITALTTLVAQNANISNTLQLTNATMNINNGTLFVNPSKNIGIGTTRPQSILHVVVNGTSTYSPADNRSWNAIRIQNRNNGINTAASILLVPDERSPSISIGSGISAVRSTSLASSGSDLVFTTDANSNTPAEGMRITEAGRVGIGTSTPRAQLDVNGTTYFNSTVTINGTLSAGTFTATNNITFQTPNGKTLFQNTVSANNTLEITNGLYFKGTNTPSLITNHGTLYMSSSDRNLYFLRPTGTTLNLTAAYTGRTSVIPFFNASNSLDDNANLYWNNTSKTLTVGTSNTVTNVQILSTLGNTNPTTFAAHSIGLGFANRSTASTNKFTGLDIQLRGQTPTDPFTFGRLAQNEVAVGLNVDVTSLSAKRTNAQGGALKGFKYAALFSGGNVGIGTTTPRAALHIASEVSGNATLIVNAKQADGTDVPNALVVTGNGYVGLGTAAPQSRLHVVGVDNTANNASLQVVDSSNNPVLIVKNNGNVGIGKTNPSTKLDINGTLTAGTATFGGVTGTTLNVGNGSLFVNANGQVGIGTVTPTGNINFYKNLTAAVAGSTFTSQKMDLVISGGTSNSLFYLDKNITGLNVNFTSNSNDALQSSKKATGIKVDMTKLGLQGSSKAVGLDIDVTGTTGTRYAAIFQGGSVGIGTTAPAAALHVSGNIITNTLTSSGGMNIGKVTTNTLVVTGTGRFSGRVTANILEATTVSANNLTLSGSLTLDKANFTTLRSTTANFTALGVGVTPNSGLEVSGNIAITKGRFGIGTLTPAASLHVVGDNINNAVAIDVKNGSTITTNVFVVTKAGRVGVGTGNATAKFAVVGDNNAANTFAMKVVGQSNTPILSVQNDGKISIGNVSPAQAQLHVKSAAIAPIVIETTAITNAFVVSQNGRVGVGTSNPSAQFAIFSSIDPLKINTAEKNNALWVDSTGKVGIGSSTLSYPLNVSGNILTGDAPTTGLASWINSNRTAGLLSGLGNKYGFFGTKEKTTGSNTYNAVIGWGGASTDTLVFENASGKVMYIQGSGEVGIGATSNAQLTVQGAGGSTPILQMGTATNPYALFVGSTGKVGVGTSNPTAELTVSGNLMAKTLTILNDSVNISTLNVSKQLNISKTLGTTTLPVVAQSVTMNLNGDVSNTIVGLDINLNSLQHASLARKNALYNANAYGLKVDMTNLEVTSPLLGDGTNGNKYAATFTGGAVGIGTTLPTTLLHVIGSPGEDIAQFGTLQNAALTIQDVDSGVMRLNMIDQSSSVKSETLVLNNDKVGIGTSVDSLKNDLAEVKLVVNGDVRVGTIRNDAAITTNSYGAKVYFSGAGDISSTADNDNNSPMWISRYNIYSASGAQQSELRVNVGNGDGDKLTVGYLKNGSNYTPTLIVIPSQNVNGNRVGITDGSVTNFAPKAPLHVVGNTSGASDTVANHLMVIENTGGANADSLVIWHNGFSGSPSTAKVPTTSNFITFMDQTNILGEIEGSGENGVRFKTLGADYAEYLEKSDPTERFEKGDIVGVFNGKVSKKTNGASQLMVKSTAAGVAGNWPGRNKERNYELIAFFGQVKVKVIGKAHKGDYILPSGLEDGSGIAISEDKLKPEDMANIVGRAWEEKTSEGKDVILTAVGFNFNTPSLISHAKNIDALQSELKAIKEKQEQQSKNFEKTLEDQNKEIDALLSKLKQ